MRAKAVSLNMFLAALVLAMVGCVEYTVIPAFERGEIATCEMAAHSDARMAKALAFLKRSDLKDLEPGRYEIDGDDVYALVQECELKSIPDMKVEAHRRYVDIQAPLTGAEGYGIGLLTEANKKLPFDETKDIGFYDQPMKTVVVHPGEYIIFRPPDEAHGPACRVNDQGRIKKVVIKVRKF